MTAIDISSEKLALAKSFGAMQTFNGREMSAPQMQSVLRELRFDRLILETAGVPQTVELAVELPVLMPNWRWWARCIRICI